MSRDKPRVFGVLAEFEGPSALLDAIHRARSEGYTQMEAYTPYPIEEVVHAIGHKKSILPYLVLAGGLFGCVGGFLFQYWASVIAYPMNIGGRPLNSWPAFIVPTFEMTILGAALAAVLGMFAVNGLPMPYHPVFNVQRFKLASRDRYFLAIAHNDPQFDAEATRSFLEGLGASEVFDVDP